MEIKAPSSDEYRRRKSEKIHESVKRNSIAGNDTAEHAVLVFIINRPYRA